MSHLAAKPKSLSSVLAANFMTSIEVLVRLYLPVNKEQQNSTRVNTHGALCTVGAVFFFRRHDGISSVNLSVQVWDCHDMLLSVVIVIYSGPLT